MRALKAGDHRTAAVLLAEAVRSRPHRADAHVNLGDALCRSGAIEGARAAYVRALEEEPQHRVALRRLASLPPRPPGRGAFRLGQVLHGDTTLGSFTVLDAKQGGFGTVYFVKDATGDRYALKTFQAQLLWSDEDRDRFMREAVVWVRLEPHPNVVTAYWVEMIEGFPCLVLEYVEGGDLADALQRGPMERTQALMTGVMFCDGMLHASRQLGIVHRDVKPSNCLLYKGYVPKVADFGLARAFDQALERDLGITGLSARGEYTTPLGTRAFMAPEQSDPDAVLDTRTDIYAFGLMLHQMLGGTLPEKGRTPADHVAMGPLRNTLPATLVELIVACVDCDPQSRPSDFADVRSVLASCYERETGKRVHEPYPVLEPHWTILQNQGLSLSTLGLHQEALAAFGRALAQAPEEPTLQNDLGLALHLQGRHAEALTYLERAVFTPDKEHLVLRNKQAVLLALGRVDEAASCAARALEGRPTDPGLWRNLAVSLVMGGRHAEAYDACEQGLRLDNRDAHLWIVKAEAAFGVGDANAALKSADRAIAIAPRDGSAWTARALALSALFRWDEARHSIDQATALGDQDPRLAVLEQRADQVLEAAAKPSNDERPFLEALQRQDRAAAFIGARDYEQALAYADRGLRLLERTPPEMAQWPRNAGNPSSRPLAVALRINMAAALSGLGRHEEALSFNDDALALDPNDTTAWQGRAATLQNLGRYAEAVVCCDEALRIAPGDGERLYEKAVLLHLQGDYRSCLPAAQAAVNALPDDPRPHWVAALAAAELGRMVDYMEHKRRAELLTGRAAGFGRDGR